MKKYLLIALLLSGCGTTGVTNPELLNKPVLNNNARVIVQRDNSLMYMGAKADVLLNGTEIASLGRGGTVVKDIAIGHSYLSVKAPMTYGNYTTSFKAEGGQTYSFEISPNKAKSLLPGMAFGIAGEAVSNTGYFQIVRK